MKRKHEEHDDIDEYTNKKENTSRSHFDGLLVFKSPALSLHIHTSWCESIAAVLM